MANRWGNGGNSGWLFFLDSKITADGDYSHEIKRPLLLGRKAVTNLESILKSRDITLPTKVCLLFLLAILIPACASSSTGLCMKYSAYKLNKQGDNIQLWWTPFPIQKQPVVPCLILPVASWPAYKFLRKQVRQFAIPFTWRFFHSVLWSTQSKALV